MSDRPKWMKDAAWENHDTHCPYGRHLKSMCRNAIAEDIDCIARHYSTEAERVRELRTAARIVYLLSHRTTDTWERLRKALEGWEK